MCTRHGNKVPVWRDEEKGTICPILLKLPEVNKICWWFVECLLYLDHNFLPSLLTTLVPSLCHSPDASKTINLLCLLSLLVRFEVLSQLPARLKTTKITINLNMPVNIVQRIKKTSDEIDEVLLRGRDFWEAHGAIQMRLSTQYILLCLSSYHLNQKPCISPQIIEWLSHKLENSIGGIFVFLWDDWGVCCSFWCWLDHSFEARQLPASQIHTPLILWRLFEFSITATITIYEERMVFKFGCTIQCFLCTLHHSNSTFFPSFHIIKKRFLLPMHWYNTPYYRLDCSRDMRPQLLAVVYLSAFKISGKKIGSRPKFRN